MNNYKRYKKQYEKDLQTIESSDKLYRKSLEENDIDKTKYESLGNVYTKYLDETKRESFF